MYKAVILLLLLHGLAAAAQPGTYSVANLHSHNDYEKPFPFWAAYNQAYGSIEADIFLYHGKLVVAHDTIQRRWERTLDSLYLEPLQRCLRNNNGYPYADKKRGLQLLVDIKADSTATLDRLIQILQGYPLITRSPAIRIVITGNRPPIARFGDYPAFVYFDGELHADYPAPAVKRIAMLSDNFRTYSSWNGTDPLPLKDKELLEKFIAKAHRLHKKVRFWNAPDNINSWKTFMGLGVDYINTDHIEMAAAFFKKLPHS